MQGFTYVVPAAILGIGVWCLTRLVEWPPRSKCALRRRSTLLGAAVFSAIWLGIEVGTIAIAHRHSRRDRRQQDLRRLSGDRRRVHVRADRRGSYVIRIAKRLRQQEARAARAEAAAHARRAGGAARPAQPAFLVQHAAHADRARARDPETAEHALERFGDMLRYVLDVKRSAREDVTLADEMQFVRNYLVARAASAWRPAARRRASRSRRFTCSWWRSPYRGSLVGRQCSASARGQFLRAAVAAAFATAPAPSP